MPAESLEASAEQAALQHALSKGYIDHAQLQQVVQLRDASRQRGQPANVVAILSTRFLQPAQAQEVHQVYQRRMQHSSGPGHTVALPPRSDEAPVTRLRRGSDRLAQADPFLSAPPRNTDAEATQVEQATQAGGLDESTEMTRTLKRSSDSGAVERIGDYVIQRELARGGMGVVYVGHKPGLERKVAIKILLNAELAASEDVERFKVEAQATSRLKHPGIVTVYDVGEDNGRPYIVMELVEGESLKAKLLRDGPLPAKEAARITKALAEAMAFAHRGGILHRDLKPSNVLLDGEGEPKITDFGLAKDLKRSEDGEPGLTLTGDVMGTPAYMPPEQATGELEHIDRRSDVYSLGATLYEMLTRRPPFEGTNAMRILSSVMVDDPTPPGILRPGLDRDLETICLKCLEKRPVDRYANAKQLAMDLGRFLDTRPILARPPTLRERVDKWFRRNRGAAVAIATLVLLLGMGAGAFIVRENMARDTARKELIQRVEGKKATSRAAYEAAAAPEQRTPLPERLALALEWSKHAASHDLLLNNEATQPADPAAREEAERAAREVGDLAYASRLYLLAAKAYEHLPDAEGDALERSSLLAKALADLFERAEEIQIGQSLQDKLSEFQALIAAHEEAADADHERDWLGPVLDRVGRAAAKTRATRINQLIARLATLKRRDGSFHFDDEALSRIKRALTEDRRDVRERLLTAPSELSEALAEVELPPEITPEQWLGSLAGTRVDSESQIAVLCVAVLDRDYDPPLRQAEQDQIRSALLEYVDADWREVTRKGQELQTRVLERVQGGTLYEEAMRARRSGSFLGLEARADPPPPPPSPARMSDLLQQAHQAREERRLKDALQLIDRALELEPNDLDLWLERIELLAGLEALDEALLACDRAVDLAPNETAPWKHRAITHARLGNHEQALDDLQSVLRLDPSDTHAYWTASTLHMQLQQPDLARQALEALLRRAQPDDRYRAQAEERLRDLR